MKTLMLLSILILQINLNANPKNNEDFSSSTSRPPATPSWYDSNWYQKGAIQALMYYSKVRDFLHANNLFAPKEDLRSIYQCDPKTIKYRSANGTCNNLDLPLMGAAGTRFSRMVNDSFVKTRLNELSPSPRELSLELFTRSEYKKTINSNFFASAFLHFVVHDWFSHQDDTRKYIAVENLSESDPVRQNYGQDKMAFWSSVNVASSDKSVPEYLNKTTHWFDASQLYGSDLKTQLKLRTMSNGLMKIEGSHLPLDDNGEEIAGDTRNWWVGLSLVHNIFTREHNAIATALKKSYPLMQDEELFQKARLINSAVITKIFLTEQVLPRLVNKNFHMINLANWYGLLPVVTHFGKLGEHIDYGKIGEVDFDNKLEEFIKIIDAPELTGLVGGPLNTRQTPFAMTEEWSHIYRYHTILPDYLHVVSEQKQVLEVIPLEATRGSAAHEVIKKHGMENVLRGFGYQYGGSATLNNTPKFLQELELPLVGKVDIAAMDIYRERERGIPRFNELRRLFGLRPYKNFSEITVNKDVVAKLNRLYNNDIEKLDTTVGLLAEDHGLGLELGETTTQVLAILASRRIESDRFYTTDFNANVYTEFGIEWINKSTLKRIFLRHYPSLDADLKSVVNADVVWSKRKTTVK